MNSNTVEQELPENIEVVTPGTLLREAREALGLSRDAVASKLNLRLSQISAIEENEFDELPSITFARGYLRSYAKTVHISESEVLAAFEYWSSAEQQQLEMQSFSHRASQRAQDNWLLIVGYVIVILLVASAVFWWMQQNEPDATVTQPQSNPTEVAAGQAEPVADEQNDTNPPPRPQSRPAGEQSSVADGGTVDALTQVADSDNLQTDLQPLVDTAQVDAPITDDAIQIDGSSAENSEPAETPSEPKLAHLELRFSGDCWINIEDASGERIAIGTKTKGHLTSVEGVPPFTIKLGKPDVVTIYLNGEQRQIPYYPKGSIANFELDLKPTDP